MELFDIDNKVYEMEMEKIDLETDLYDENSNLDDLIDDMEDEEKLKDRIKRLKFEIASDYSSLFLLLNN